MRHDEVMQVINRMKDTCRYNGFSNPGTIQAYQRALGGLDFQATIIAVDKLMAEDSNNVPLVSDIVKVYRSNPRNKETTLNQEHCDICNDKGYILMKERTEKYDNMESEFVLHCICPVGLEQKYEGSELKEKSKYRVPSVTEYFDGQALEEMKKSNRNRWKLSDEQKEHLRIQLRKLGITMPAHMDKADPWEGEQEEIPPWIF